MLKKKKGKSKLLENTFMLYLLTFSNYFFNLITVPLQTRVLGPEIFGRIGFCLAVSTYFRLLYDFGFLLSATEDVSKNYKDKKYVSKVFTSVNFIKVILVIVSVIPLIVLLFTVDIFKNDPLLFILYFIYVAIDCFEPDFLYRGYEQMKAITIRNVFVKLFFTIMIFLFLKKSTDYMIIPILNIIGAVVALFLVYRDVKKRFGINFCKVDKVDVKRCFSRSRIFFLSRIASTLYGATNTFILGLIYPTGPVLGHYTSSDKVLSATRQAISPISDSVYPHMVKNKDFNLIKRLLKIFMPIIIVGCTVVFIFAKPLCIFAFGKEYAESAVILRFMIPIIIMTLPTYLLGFPTMSPLGISNKANLSVIISSIYHAIGLLVLYLFGVLNITSLCILTITTESLVLLIRIYYIYKNRDKFKQ